MGQSGEWGGEKRTVQGLVAVQPEKGKGTEDGAANPTVDRYLEEPDNGNNA